MFHIHCLKKEVIIVSFEQFLQRSSFTSLSDIAQIILKSHFSCNLYMVQERLDLLLTSISFDQTISQCTSVSLSHIGDYHDQPLIVLLMS